MRGGMRVVTTRVPLSPWRRQGPPQKPSRGYLRLYTDRVTQAEHGCDFDFLAGEKA